MHVFDPTALEWTQIKPNEVLGLFPVARNSFGFVSANRNLYVYGGESASGLLPLIFNSYLKGLKGIMNTQTYVPCVVPSNMLLVSAIQNYN